MLFKLEKIHIQGKNLIYIYLLLWGYQSFSVIVWRDCFLYKVYFDHFEKIKVIIF